MTSFWALALEVWSLTKRTNGFLAGPNPLLNCRSPFGAGRRDGVGRPFEELLGKPPQRPDGLCGRASFGEILANLTSIVQHFAGPAVSSNHSSARSAMSREPLPHHN